MKGLKLEHLSKSYDKIKAVQDVTLNVDSKSFIVLAGPSGCGKTTLLQMIAGLLDSDSGHVILDGEDISEEKPSKRGIAMVFQDAALFLDMSVNENIELGLSYVGLSNDEIKKRVQDMASLVDIEDLLERKAKTLSNGQKQRVSIARALVRQPKLFLMDEPLSALDARLKNQLRLEIAMLYQKLDATFLYVTHDQVEALTLADILIIMKDGIFQQIGKPMEIYHNPKNLFTASFLGKYEINHFIGEIKNQQLYFEQHCVPIQESVEDQEVLIGVRAEHIQFDELYGYEGEVVLIENLGDELYYHIQWKDNLIIMKGNFHENVRIMDKVKFSFCLQDVFYFEANTKERLYLTVIQ